MQIELSRDNFLLFLLANFTGVVGGVFVLVVLQPQTDFYYLLPAFVLFGLIAANLVLAVLLELSKEPKEETATKR